MHPELARTSLRPLLPRERQVLAGVQSGLSNRQIAQTLHVCEDTVKYHLKRIFLKFGVSRRSQAVAVAVFNGLLDTGPQAADGRPGVEERRNSGDSESHADC